MNKPPKRAFDLKAFIKAISSPQVWPFISKEKLVKSEEFEKLVDHFDAHFDAYKDTGPFERLLHLLDGSKYAEVLAEHLRARHNVIVQRENGAIKVHVKKGLTPREGVKKAPSFRNHIDKPTSAIRTIPSSKSDTQGAWDKSQYIDALDHPARLPGSFGHGQRR